MNMKKVRYTVFETAWGYAGFSAGPKGVMQLALPARTRRRAAARFRGAAFDAGLMKDLQEALKRYFEGMAVDFRVWPCLSPNATTEFGKAVMRECRKLRWGERITYGDLARRAGRRGAARAVGTILAQNPIPVIVPCHRVVRADGRPGGYSGEGGVRMKRRLLALESMGAAGF